MKTIATFGCSYTAGHGTSKRRWINWPAELSLLLNDKIKLINCAKGGTSIDYSVHVLETFLKSYKPDIVLFQFTSPRRLSYLPNISPQDDIFDLLTYKEYVEKTPCHENIKDYCNLTNYYKYWLKDNIEWGFITPGSTKSTFSNQKLAKHYYSSVGENRISYTTYNAYFLYIKTLLKDVPHLLLSHDATHESLLDSNNIDIDFKTALGTEYFEQNIIDEGKHLSKKALAKVAKTVYNELQLRNAL